MKVKKLLKQVEYMYFNCANFAKTLTDSNLTIEHYLCDLIRGDESRKTFLENYKSFKEATK